MLNATLAGSMPREVYADTNAVSNLYSYEALSEDELAEIRRKLAAPASAFALMTSPTILQELAPLRRSQPGLYRRISRELPDLVGPRVFDHTNHLVEKELRRVRPVREEERFLVRADRRAVWSLFRQARVVAGVTRQTRAELEEFKRDEERHRETVRARFAPADIQRELRAWWADAEPVVEDWTKDFIRGAGRMHLPPGIEPDSVDPRTIPALWSFYSYRMARIYLNVGEGRRIQPSDLLDAHHFVAAHYAGLLVTDDRACRDTIARIPSTGVRVITFQEFAATVLGG